MEDTFTIPVSFDEFVTWLNGHTRRTKVLPPEVMTFDGRISARMTAHGAWHVFTVQDEDDARATLRAELWSGIEPTQEAKQWHADTLQAIRVKWPQRTKKKPGRHKMKCNAWAQEQARQGRTVDDILDEWCKRYSQENGPDALHTLADPRASCTEAMRGAWPKK